MKITVYGGGYVGLVTAGCFADVGHHTVCMDIDKERIEGLQNGKIPIYEPGLKEVIDRTTSRQLLEFTLDPAYAVTHGELQFIAVGTPPNGDGSTDLKNVMSVARTIAKYMQSYKLIIVKSTAPVGTVDKINKEVSIILKDRHSEISYDVCSNPEFLKEGAAIDDFTRGPRIIVGTDSGLVKELMQECYAPYNRNHNKLIFMDIRAAELTKYAANAMLATKISFMNEIANISERLNVDVEQIRQGIGSDPRIGYQFIYPGCGYGGSCFPKDIRALTQAANHAGYETELLKAVETVNNRQKQVIYEKLLWVFDGDLSGKTIALWGLSFKPNTDDMREAPSRALMESLWAAGAKINAYDPQATNEAKRIYGDREDLCLMQHRDDTLRGASALAICTEWKEFRTIDFGWLKQQLISPVIVDGRNLFDPKEIKKFGLNYFAVGRGDSNSLTKKSLPKIGHLTNKHQLEKIDVPIK